LRRHPRYTLPTMGLTDDYVLGIRRAARIARSMRLAAGASGHSDEALALARTIELQILMLAAKEEETTSFIRVPEELRGKK
jgi:hypothetical protein